MSGSESNVKISVVELEKILDIAKSAGVKEVQISTSSSSGIGCNVACIFNAVYNGVSGTFSCDVTDYDKW